ncbi:unnamed protein product [Somion occarium]|uniref:Ribonucleases P/MRP subunit Pop8-like domain-containing protein n=2 Tax=Somion occarium TaxID=3059160 RepID=A0ABP1CRA3_9APHY
MIRHRSIDYVVNVMFKASPAPPQADTMPPQSLANDYHYIRLSVNPPSTEALSLRKAMQDALSQSFGLISANTYIDVLWLSDDGSQMVVRVSNSEARKVMAAVATFTGSPALSVVKESSFLPSLLSSKPYP